jgi:hypothetical protein
MALLRKHRRSLGNPNYAAPKAGRVLRRESKYSPAWALSADGTSGKTYDDHGLRRVRVEISQFICKDGRVVGEVVYKPGQVLAREGYFHSSHGVGETLDLRLRDGKWEALLALESGEEVWLNISECRGLASITGIKPGCTIEDPNKDTWTDDPDSLPAPTYEEWVAYLAKFRRPIMGMPVAR